MGAILDAHCISWGYSKCGGKTNCYDYNIDKVSHSLVIFGVSVSGKGVLIKGVKGEKRNHALK